MFAKSTFLSNNYNKDNTTVIAYRYRCTIAAGAIDMAHGGNNIIEFFIPSLNMCFNEKAAFTADHARNVLGSDMYTYRSPLTEVYLPTALVDKITEAKKVLEKAEKSNVNWGSNSLIDDEQFIKLFSMMTAEIKEGNCIRILNPEFLGNENDFEVAYREFGNDALPPY